MFKCTGICSSCGRCKDSAMMSGANDRKTKMISYPDNFKADKGGLGKGIAFDIGTTTVVGMLWNLEKGEPVKACAKTNPQNKYGMDVISRITFCQEDEENLNLLRKEITGCLNSIIDELCEETNTQNSEITRVAICGNTTMSHLVTGHSPISLALAPFHLDYTGTIKMDKTTSGLDIGDNAEVTVIANIAGHVGGDITAGIVATRLLDKNKTTIFIDIGTNGEIVLVDRDKAYACSTAAGPAFEGSAIVHGMRAAAGAIERVKIKDGDVFFKTIGDCEPQGICGSGLIDAIAQMIENKLINKSGRLISADDVDKLGLDSGFRDRLIKVGRERQFILVNRENKENIVITQNDIREIQLAKGAIAAGIKLMLEGIGKTIEDIYQIIVAGAFGNYIDKDSAVTIGILPEISRDRIVFAGNTAGAGISMVLASEKEYRLASEIPDMVKHVELAEKKNFQEVYLASMAF